MISLPRDQIVNERSRFKSLLLVFIAFGASLSGSALSAEIPSLCAGDAKIKVTRHDLGSEWNTKPVEVLTAEKWKVVFRVDEIPVQAELKDNLILSFGNQRVDSSELETGWIPINGNYGFDGLQTVDFDQDGIEDAVATFKGIPGFKWV